MTRKSQMVPAFKHAAGMNTSNPLNILSAKYTSPFCVITEGKAPVPSWVHKQVQEALTMDTSPQLVNKVAVLHFLHLLEPAKASTVAAKTRSTVSSAPPCTNTDYALR